MRCNTVAMKLNGVWLWVTSIFLNVKCLHARTNDCMPRDTFMNRGDSNGWRLIGFVFHYYKKISLGDCAEECLRRTKCKSLNYNAFTMHCELNAENSKTMPANMSSDPECYHSLRSTWETGNLLLGFTLPICAVNEKVSATDNKTCLRAECDEPPERQFAKYTSTLRELDSVVKYSCLSQYGSLGDVTGTCKGNGTWESNSFECFRNCTHPPVVNHATIKPLWALKTQFLSYVCDANYEAAGDTQISCQANGSWTEMNFLCLRICENPPLVPNSSPNASRTLDGRTVSYTCHVDYVGFGNTEVLCRPDGTWSNATYICIRECKNPPTVPMSTPGATKVLHGNSTFYACNMNYVVWPPNTSTEARCESDGRWTLLGNFSCKRECTNPPSLDFGTANKSSALEGSSVTYMCNAGYDYIDVIRSTCNANGNWTAPSSSCLRVCENPQSVQNSSPNATRTVDGRGVAYTCHDNYVGFGKNEILCNPDGSWSKSVYVCIRECVNPPTVLNSTPNQTRVLHGNSTIYKCNMNYVVWPPDVNTEASCESDGTWTFLANFSCKRDCTNPPSITFGSANKSSALEGSSVTYTCDVGYKAVAHITSMCTAMGNWTAPSSLCLRECTNPPSLKNGTANTSSALEGSSVAYVCDNGYISVAAIKTTCTASGNWTTPSSSCLRECVNPPTVLNSTPNKTRVLHGNSTIYKCNMNYVVWPPDVNTEASCESDGTWTFLANFSCKRECKNPPLVPNSTPSETKVLQGNSTVYACNKSYAVWPPGTATKARCESNGEWIFWAKFSCKRECTDPPSLTFGRANETSALEGSSVAYMCDNGYNSIAAINSTCTSSGNWTELSSSCLRECTDPPSPLQNATTTATSALAGQAIFYMCNDGLSSVNVTEMVCLEEGNWSEANFLCE